MLVCKKEPVKQPSKEVSMPKEEWVIMSQAAKRLNVPLTLISRLASRGDIQVKNDPLNRRIRLVEFNQVKSIIEQSTYYNPT
jgi:hypothetical protein